MSLRGNMLGLAAMMALDGAGVAGDLVAHHPGGERDRAPRPVDPGTLEPTRLKAGRGVPQGAQEAAKAAAKAVADAGGSPAAQLAAARKATGPGVKLGYVSHQGARQRARALERLAKQQAKADPVP